MAERMRAGHHADVDWNAWPVERYIAEIATLPLPAHEGPPDEQALGAVMARYGLSRWT